MSLGKVVHTVAVIIAIIGTVVQTAQTLFPAPPPAPPPSIVTPTEVAAQFCGTPDVCESLRNALKEADAIDAEAHAGARPPGPLAILPIPPPGPNATKVGAVSSAK